MPRRATRRYRCARCGHQATYPNATATQARYWFSRHSCRKVEDQWVRARTREQREALIDRTPKPCHHKQANHQHGTNACYRLDQCRCLPCTQAARKYEDNRNRQIAYGRWNNYVPGEHVRAHIAELQAYGIGPKRLSELSGVPHGAISKIIYGVYAPGPAGRNGKGDKVREPSRRVRRATAEKLYAIEPVPANLGARVPDPDRTPLARLHLRALVALGWSMSEIGRRLGMNHPTNAQRMITGDKPMGRGTVDRAEALFAELCMTLPPETTHRQRISATRARTLAKQNGWRPPLALPDLLDEEAS